MGPLRLSDNAIKTFRENPYTFFVVYQPVDLEANARGHFEVSYSTQRTLRATHLGGFLASTYQNSHVSIDGNVLVADLGNPLTSIIERMQGHDKRIAMLVSLLEREAAALIARSRPSSPPVKPKRKLVI